MSLRIERTEHRHLNVKRQDEWNLRDGGNTLDPEQVTLVLTTRKVGGVAIGKLYLNGISLEALEQLAETITRFLPRQREKVRRLLEEQAKFDAKFTAWEAGEGPCPFDAPAPMTDNT